MKSFIYIDRYSWSLFTWLLLANIIGLFEAIYLSASDKKIDFVLISHSIIIYSLFGLLGGLCLGLLLDIIMRIKRKPLSITRLISINSGAVISILFFVTVGFSLNFYLFMYNVFFKILRLVLTGSVFILSIILYLFIRRLIYYMLGKNINIELLELIRKWFFVSLLTLLFFSVIFIHLKVKYNYLSYLNGLINSRQIRSNNIKKILDEEENLPNIIFIIIDTLRADHLSAYGYPKKTSPQIDNLAREGVLFSQAISQSSWTSPSVASIFTSLYPSMHGVKKSFCGFGGSTILDDSYLTMAEILRDRGYKCYGFVANEFLGKYFGYGQGFDLYIDNNDRSKNGTRFRKFKLYEALAFSLHNLGFTRATDDMLFDAEEINREVFHWIEAMGKERFFLYIHYMDPHMPYHAHPPKLFDRYQLSPKYLNKIIENYDQEIAYVDEQIGLLMEKLKEKGWYKNSLIILTSDHGEEFMDHGSWDHGQNIYDEVIHVPLIMKYTTLLPKNRVISKPVSSIDILPTILNILNIELKDNIKMEGKSLLPLILGKEVNPAAEVYSEVEHMNIYSYRSIRTDRWKLIYKWENRGCRQPTLSKELFDLEADPFEKENLYGNSLRKELILTKKLEEWINYLQRYSPPSKKKIRKIDKESLKRLKALGYVY